MRAGAANVAKSKLCDARWCNRVSEVVIARVRSPTKAKVLRSVGQRPRPAGSRTLPSCHSIVNDPTVRVSPISTVPLINLLLRECRTANFETMLNWM